MDVLSVTNAIYTTVSSSAHVALNRVREVLPCSSALDRRSCPSPPTCSPTIASASTVDEVISIISNCKDGETGVPDSTPRCHSTDRLYTPPTASAFIGLNRKEDTYFSRNSCSPGRRQCEVGSDPFNSGSVSTMATPHQLISDIALLGEGDGDVL